MVLIALFIGPFLRESVNKSPEELGSVLSRESDPDRQIIGKERHEVPIAIFIQVRHVIELGCIQTGWCRILLLVSDGQFEVQSWQYVRSPPIINEIEMTGQSTYFRFFPFGYNRTDNLPPFSSRYV